MVYGFSIKGWSEVDIGGLLLQESLWNIYETDEFSLQNMHRKSSTTKMNHQQNEAPSTWITINMNHINMNHQQHESPNIDATNMNHPTNHCHPLVPDPWLCRRDQFDELGCGHHGAFGLKNCLEKQHISPRGFRLAEDTNLRWTNQIQICMGWSMYRIFTYTAYTFTYIFLPSKSIKLRWFFTDWDPMAIHHHHSPPIWGLRFSGHEFSLGSSWRVANPRSWRLFFGEWYLDVPGS